MRATRHNPTLSRVLEEERVRRGLTKWRLAIATGLSLNTVRAAFNGLATTRTLNLLARAIGVDVDTLRGRNVTDAVLNVHPARAIGVDVDTLRGRNVTDAVLAQLDGRAGAMIAEARGREIKAVDAALAEVDGRAGAVVEQALRQIGAGAAARRGGRR